MRVVGSSEGKIAVAEQDHSANIVGSGIVQDGELLPRVFEIPLLVIGERKVHKHNVLILEGRKRGPVHLDGFIELAFVRQCGSEVDPRLRVIRTKFDHLAISGDSGGVIPVLLRFDGVAENRVGIGILAGQYSWKQREK